MLRSWLRSGYCNNATVFMVSMEALNEKKHIDLRKTHFNMFLLNQHRFVFYILIYFSIRCNLVFSIFFTFLMVFYAFFMRFSLIFYKF